MQYILKRILQDKDITMKLSKKILFPVLFVFITSCFLYYQYKVYNYTVLEIIFPIKNKFWLHRTISAAFIDLKTNIADLRLT